MNIQSKYIVNVHVCLYVCMCVYECATIRLSLYQKKMLLHTYDMFFPRKYSQADKITKSVEMTK